MREEDGMNLLYFVLILFCEFLEVEVMIFILIVEVIDHFRELSNLFAHAVLRSQPFAKSALNDTARKASI